MFRVDIDEFSSAATAVSSAATRAGESVTRVGKVNLGFASLMSGAWMIAESHAYADLEVTLRMLAEGLTAMGATYADALASLEGELAPARDALLSAALSTPASPQVVRFEPYHNVAGACDFADGSLEDLRMAVAAAESALTGLESSGGVADPLSGLSSLAGTQGTAIGEIRSSYMTYEAAVDAFEEEYANRLKPGEFVTDAMRETVAADLRAQYGEALDSGPFAFIDAFGDVSAALAAAAVVEVGEGLVEFGTGAAVGAAVGAIGGPVGVALGVGVGWVAGEAVEWCLDTFASTGAKEDVVGWVSDRLEDVADFFGF